MLPCRLLKQEEQEISYLVPQFIKITFNNEVLYQTPMTQSQNKEEAFRSFVLN